MKKYSITILFLSIVLINNSYSQKDTSDTKNGLFFSISGLDFEGGLGGKYWFNSKDAIRIGFDGNFTKNSFTSSTYSVNINIGYERHIDSFDIISPYYCGSIQYTKRNSFISYNIYGLLGYVGIELSLGKNVYVSFEQGLLFSYTGYNDNSSPHYIAISTSKPGLYLTVYI